MNQEFIKAAMHKLRKGNAVEFALDSAKERLKYPSGVMRVKYKRISHNKGRLYCYKRLSKLFSEFLRDYVPPQEVSRITSQRPQTVWWCWLQGVQDAPELVRCCLHSVEKNLVGPNKLKLVLIDEENCRLFTDLPDFIIHKYAGGGDIVGTLC